MNAEFREHHREVSEYIEVAIAELRGVAQPRDIAELRALMLDVLEAETLEQLSSIRAQAHNLREFCERRTSSSREVDRVVSPPALWDRWRRM